MVFVPQTYTYTAPDGVEYCGNAAYVLNHLDSAEAYIDSMVAAGQSWVELQTALNFLLDNAHLMAQVL